MTKNWGWMMAVGVLMIILGGAGLSMQAIVTIASMFYFGFMALFAGILTIAGTFGAEGWKSKTWHIIIGLLYIAAGIVMIINPVSSAVWITLFIAASFLAIGIMRLIAGFSMREIQGWGLTVMAGAAAIILGILLIVKWPITGIWAIGMFVSIDFLMQGISLVSAAWAARKFRASEAEKLSPAEA